MPTQRPPLAARATEDGLLGATDLRISQLQAADLAVAPGTAGQLVAAYSLAYAVSAPVLTTLTHRLNKRWLLLFSIRFHGR
jgi:DHA1 family putative efflux transporter-like MFS transporter